MEHPVHYLTALRRRWWVIVAAMAVAVATAWFTTPTSHDAPVTTSTAAYSATTVLWDPEATAGAQTTTAAGSITGMDALAQVVTLPDVVAIAAQDMDYQGSPSTLANQVQASADATSGFLHITGYGADRSTAEQVSTAFAHALRQYLEQIKARRADQQQAQLEGADRGGEGPGRDPRRARPAPTRPVAARAGSDGADLAHDHPETRRPSRRPARVSSRRRAARGVPSWRRSSACSRGSRSRSSWSATTRGSAPATTPRPGSRCRSWRRSPTSRDDGGSRW